MTKHVIDRLGLVILCAAVELASILYGWSPWLIGVFAWFGGILCTLLLNEVVGEMSRRGDEEG